jgi:hypothetical protein
LCVAVILWSSLKALNCRASGVSLWGLHDAVTLRCCHHRSQPPVT